MAQPEVTFALTSANRLDLLAVTLKSFLEFNSYPITKYLLIEDSGNEKTAHTIRQKWPFFEVIFNRPQIGQTASIDRMYAQIQTEYVFHCEDDWQFLDYGFLERSMEILTQPGNEKIVQVWLRGLHDTNGHTILTHQKYQAGKTEYYLLSTHHQYQIYDYGGFAYQPGLRRLSDYRLVAPYAAVGNVTEALVSARYRELGYKAATLIPKYIKHIGVNRHVNRNGLI